MKHLVSARAMRAALPVLAGIGALLGATAAHAQRARVPVFSSDDWGAIAAPVYGRPEPDPAYQGSAAFKTPDLFAGPKKFGDDYYAGVLPSGQIVRPAGKSVQVGMNPLNAALTPDGKFLITSNDDERESDGATDNSLQSKVNKGGYSLSVLDAKTLAVVSQTDTAGPFFIGLQATGAGPYTLYASGGADTDAKTQENSVKVFTLSATGAISPMPTATILIAPITPSTEGYVSNYTPAKTFSGPKPSQFSKTGAKITFPAGMALSPDGKFLYVACNGDNSLAIISTATNTVVKQIPVGYFPYGVTVSPHGGFVYVANWGVTAYKFLPGETYDAQGDLTALAHVSPPDPASSLFFVPKTNSKTDYPKTSSIAVISGVGSGMPQTTGIRYVDESQPSGIDALNVVGETHPSATAVVSHGGKTILYVTKSNSDRIGLVDTASPPYAPDEYTNLRGLVHLPDFDLSPISVTLSDGHAVHGAYPNAIVASPNGDRVYVAEAGFNSVAVLDTTDPSKPHLLGRIPTGWYPTGLAISPDGGTLYVTNAKGVGEDINSSIARNKAATGLASFAGVDSNYIFGSVQKVNLATTKINTDQVLDNNYRMLNPKKLDTRVVPLGGKPSKKITHVIFIEQENKTFDSMLGTVGKFGPFAGTTYNNFDGTTYTSTQYNPVALNTQALASAFATGVNYYSNSEESDAGHQYCASGTASDYTEKTLLVKTGRGLLVNKNFEPEDYPEGGYIFNNAVRNGVSIKDYGDMIRIQGTDTGTSVPTTIDDPDSGNAGFPAAPETVPVTELPGSDVTSLTSGLGQSYFMNLPILAVLGTKNKDGEERLDHNYPGYNFNISDQRRAREFIADFDRMVKAGTLPKYLHIYLPNDHTGGIQAKNVTGVTAPNQVADGDVALGLVVRHIMTSRIYYDKATDTGASLIMTYDDAQSTLDHIHPHRTPLILVSPFAKKGYIATHHYISASIVKTDELLLGLPPNNLGDLLATDLRDLYQPTYNGITAASIKFNDTVAYTPTAEGVKIWHLVSKIDTSAPDLDTHRLGTLARLSMAADRWHATAVRKHRLATRAYRKLQARLYQMALSLTSGSAPPDSDD